MNINYGHERLGFISYPTPFQEMKNLQTKLQVKPKIFFKRDDLTEVGLGGNKNRKLDYVMYDAVKQGADTIVTWAGLQSNHCRQTLAFAKMLGMECHLILNGAPGGLAQGNRLIFDIFGAIIHYEPEEEKCDEACENLIKKLKEQGKKPYYITIGASVPLGSLGYIDSAKEIAEQSKLAGVDVKEIFVASGSAGTQAGLEVGVRLYMPGCKVHGVAVSRKKEEQAKKVAALSREVAKFIDVNMSITDDEIIIHDEYIGKGYAIPTKEGNDAIRLVGSTQAIMLDPVYTGKAMAGMVDLLKRGEFSKSEAIVFVHTGGSPAVFNFNETFFDI